MRPPPGLCLLPPDTLLVCDQNNHRIVALGTDLSWRYTFGCQGSGDGEFRQPSAIAAHGDELFVVDHLNDRVQARRAPPPLACAVPVLSSRLSLAPRPQVLVHSSDGRIQFRRTIGGRGDAPGQFTAPCGVAIVRGLLLVSESDRLQVLTLAGAPLQVLAFGEMLGGIGVHNDLVLVADFGACQVHVLKATSLVSRERLFRT